MSQRKRFSIQTPPSGPLSPILTDIKRAIDSISADYIGAGDMIRAGLLRRLSGGGWGPGDGVGGIGVDDGNYGTPPAPTNVEVTAGYSFIMVEFSGANYPGHGYAQILRSLTNDYSSALVVGQTQFGPYVDTVGTGSPVYYYWVRFVNIASPPMTGPPNSQLGTSASTAPDVQKLLTLLANQITSSELDQSLRTPIEQVPVLSQGLAQEAIDRANAIAAEAAARVGAISNEATSRANAISSLDASIRADLATADQAVVTQLRSELAVADAAVLASAQSYTYSQAQTDAAIAAQGTLLTASFAAGDAATLSSAQNFTYSRAAIDAADAATLNTVRAEFAAGDSATLASAQNFTYSRASIDSAIASSASTLRAQITGGSSSNSLGDITSGLVHQVNSASVSRDNALAQQLTLLSAGAGEQFDYSNIWYFDTGVEDWSTVGTGSDLSAVDGWLRLVSNSGTLNDRNFISPDNLGVDGARYPQVRLRVRRVGTPVWEGVLYFLTTADATYNAAKSSTLAEPAFDANGISVITFDMPATWTSATIRRLRLDLSASISPTSHFELDWLAVGRPSPGASSAQLEALQSAMVSGDDANAQSIVNLSASLDGKADATALTALETRVTSAEGVNTSQGTSITSLQNSVTSINGALSSKADATALTALETRVTSAEGVNTSQSSSITTLQNSLTTTNNTVATKADTTALNALTTRVTSAEGTITSQGTSITGLQSSVTTINNTLPTKADATALTTTNTNVTNLGNTVTAQAGQITTIQSRLTNAPVLPSTFLAGMDDWTGSRGGSPTSVSTYSATVVTDDPDFGVCARITNMTTAGANILTKGVLPCIPGKSYRVTARFKVEALPADGAFAMNCIIPHLSETYANATNTFATSSGSITALGIYTVQATISDVAAPGVFAWAAGTKYVRFGLRLDTNESGLVLRVQSILVEDISEARALSASIQTESTTRASQTGDLFAKYTVKVDVAGHVSGFGLASTANNAAPFSAFGVRADQFYVAPPTIVQATAPTTNLYRGMTWLDTSVTPNVTRYYTGSAWSTTPQALPFVIQTSPTTINGEVVPPGIYAENAFFARLVATRGQIGLLAVDDARIASMSAGKITAGSIAVGQYIESIGYVAGSAGWRIWHNGAEFSGVVVRGTIIATAGLIGGITIASNAVRVGQTAFNTGVGFHLSSDGRLSLGNSAGRRITWDGTNLNVVSQGLSLINGAATFSGALQAATGSFSGNISGSTGSFSGTLEAGTLDVSKLVGQTVTHTSAGNYSAVVPADFTQMRVTVVGGGGGGGNRGGFTYSGAGGGGGGGGTAIATFSVSPGSTISFTVGAGGGATASGGTSIVNGYLSAAGGAPGASGTGNSSGGAGGAGGAGGSGAVANGFAGTAGGGGSAGSAGGKVSDPTPAYVGAPGVGGSTRFGNLGRGGDGGSTNTGTSGEAGRAGMVSIEFFNPNGVIIRSDWNALISALHRQGIQTV